MRQEKIRVKIFNPSRDVEAEVSIFDSMNEALETLGHTHCLTIVNDSLIQQERVRVREQLIRSLKVKQ